MANKLYLWRRRLISQLTNYIRIFTNGNFQIPDIELIGKLNFAEITKECQGNIDALIPEMRGFAIALNALFSQGNFIISPIELNGKASLGSGFSSTGNGYIILPEITFNSIPSINHISPATGNVSIATIELNGIPAASIAVFTNGMIITTAPELQSNYSIAEILRICVGSLNGNDVIFEGDATVSSTVFNINSQILLTWDVDAVVSKMESNYYTIIENAANGWTYIIDAVDYAWDGSTVRIGGRSGS